MSRKRITTHVGFWVHIGDTHVHKHVVGEVLTECFDSYLVKSTLDGNYYRVRKSDWHGHKINWKTGDI